MLVHHIQLNGISGLFVRAGVRADARICAICNVRFEEKGGWMFNKAHIGIQENTEYLKRRALGANIWRCMCNIHNLCNRTC